jgi:hypothetical protein
VFLNTEDISAFVGFTWKIELEMHGATMKIRVFLSKQTSYGRTICVLIFLVPRIYQNLLRRYHHHHPHHHLLPPAEEVSSTGNALARNIGQYSIPT